MQLVAPEILAEVLKLSPGAVYLGMMLGFMLWTTGWLKRTFWTAASITVGFGIYGLQLGKTAGTHPLVTALLLGISAGVLALELGRLIAFVSGGLATAVLMSAFVPTFPEPILAYLAGGLACVLLYKLWMLGVLGFAGTMLMMYCGLALGARLLKLDVNTLVNQKSAILNLVAVGGTVLGMIAQSRFEVYWLTREQRAKDKAMAALNEKERAAIESTKGPPQKSRLWGLMKPRQVA